MRNYLHYISLECFQGSFQRTNTNTCPAVHLPRVCLVCPWKPVGRLIPFGSEGGWICPLQPLLELSLLLLKTMWRSFRLNIRECSWPQGCQSSRDTWTMFPGIPRVGWLGCVAKSWVMILWVPGSSGYSVISTVQSGFHPKSGVSSLLVLTWAFFACSWWNLLLGHHHCSQEILISTSSHPAIPQSIWNSSTPMEFLPVCLETVHVLMKALNTTVR